ncbi:MAG: hypothetical protein IH899_14140, partial [Planctomycetes bacterium]|nr:hypothetical protein [Planctomycetota bacterium]
FGGHQGRALVEGDVLQLQKQNTNIDVARTPQEYRLAFSSTWALRICRSAESDLLQDEQLGELTNTNWIIGRRADRMGMQLDGPMMSVSSDGRMPSAPVFPGTIQCPGNGSPFMLSVDAGTTGGSRSSSFQVTETWSLLSQFVGRELSANFPDVFRRQRLMSSENENAAGAG